MRLVKENYQSKDTLQLHRHLRFHIFLARKEPAKTQDIEKKKPY
jgi:hypothetical protein